MALPFVVFLHLPCGCGRTYLLGKDILHSLGWLRSSRHFRYRNGVSKDIFSVKNILDSLGFVFYSTMRTKLIVDNGVDSALQVAQCPHTSALIEEDYTVLL